MSESKIEWTGRSDWNPVRGCTRVSPGCGGPGPHGGCYAEAMAARFSKPGMWGHGFAEMVDHKPRWTGKVELHEDRLTIPLTWRKPGFVFPNSTSDFFHEALPDEAIDKIFAVMALTPHLTYQILTKRAERMRSYFTKPHSAPNISLWQSGVCWAIDELIPVRTDQSRRAREQVLRGPLPNVWLGVSTERQQEADERIPHLLQTPAAVRFISAEPLLGPIDLSSINTAAPGYSTTQGANLDWVIVGGESGPNARPMYHGWAQSLRDQCAAAGVPFFFKQWGEHISEVVPGTDVDVSLLPRNQAVAFGDGKTNHTRYTRVGKKSAGRLLDGIEHNGMPSKVTA